MLKDVKVTPLAAESLGVRSMCTYVETPDARILLDAGVALCPNRFSLPPHPEEFRAIEKCRREIAKAAREAQIVTISHYHFDHHTPSYEDWLCNWTEADVTAREVYNGKIVLMKNPRQEVNYSQRRRGWMFQRTGGKHAERLEVADGKAFTANETVIRFSEPVFHGPENSALGWVLMTTIEFHDEKFMFAPDVQGPMSTHTLELICKQKPQLIMIGGPPLYLSQSSVDEGQIQTGLRNLAAVTEAVHHMILEHHILRDANWQQKTREVFAKAHENGHIVQTAAEFLGKHNTFLEAERKNLFAMNPPSREFRKWMNTADEAKRNVKPLI
jgi:predicted metallo-beta-lactamase superfamily hydrolase